MNDATRGAVAGVIATLPMTAAIAAARAAGLMGALPPRQVAGSAARRAGVRDGLPPPVFSLAWGASHLAYGAACGALYAAVRPRPADAPTVLGAAYGALVWAASYGAILPALRLYPPFWRQGRGVAATMGAAHLVYGAALAAVERGIGRRSRAGRERGRTDFSTALGGQSRQV